jgi:hypothetical protein
MGNTTAEATAVIHVFQQCNTADRVHFYSWFLQPVNEVDIDQQMTFFSKKVWFHLQGYINTQKNR